MQIFVIIISIIAFSAVLIAVAHEPAMEVSAGNLAGEPVATGDVIGDEPTISTTSEPTATPVSALIQDIQRQRTAPVFFEQIGPEVEQPRFSPYVLDLRGLDDQS